MRIMPLLVGLILMSCTPVPSSEVTQPSVPAQSSSSTAAVYAPLLRLEERTVIKPFGIYITREDSPVQPERFAGYHTGVDYEILSGEEEEDMPVFTICGGPLKLKRTASGYGGVAVQECEREGGTVTVLYGHLRFASIEHAVGDYLSPGDQIGLLGTGFTEETDGERAHLHLSVHRGSSIELRGYVQNENELADWIDPELLY